MYVVGSMYMVLWIIFYIGVCGIVGGVVLVTFYYVVFIHSR